MDDHIVLECSNCWAPLVAFWISDPNFEKVVKAKAKCCHCGDVSFAKDIKGLFHIGGTEYTRWTDVEEDENMIVISTVKEKQWTNR